MSEETLALKRLRYRQDEDPGRPLWLPQEQPSYLEQELTQGDKRRSVVWFLSPALQHDVIDILRTVFWLREAFALFVNLVQDLGEKKRKKMNDASCG